MFIAIQFNQFFAIAFRSNTSEFNADFFPILEISPKKCVAHLKLYLLCSRMNARDFLRSVGKCFITSQLLLLENCLLDSSAKSANIYSAAATSAKNTFHYGSGYIYVTVTFFKYRISSFFNIFRAANKSINFIIKP